MWRGLSLILLMGLSTACFITQPLTDCSDWPGVGLCPSLPPREKPKPKFSKEPYIEMIESWKGRQIDELFEYGNWGRRNSRVRICPKDCTRLKMVGVYPSAESSKVYTWYVTGDNKPESESNWVWDSEKFRYVYKEPSGWANREFCNTYVGVDDKGKIVGIWSNGTYSTSCRWFVKFGYWTPRVAPGWYD